MEVNGHLLGKLIFCIGHEIKVFLRIEIIIFRVADTQAPDLKLKVSVNKKKKNKKKRKDIATKNTDVSIESIEHKY